MFFNIWTLIFATITGGIGLYFFLSLKKLKIFENAGIPFTKPLPIVGNMAPVIFRKINIGNYLKKLYNSNANARYFGFFDFMNPVIIIRDLELIKSVAVRNFESFTDHRSFIDESWDPFFTRNLFSLKGKKWHNVRSLLSPAFSSSKMKSMYKLISQEAIKFTEFLTKDTEKNNVRDMKDIFTKYTNDVIATCAFGISVDTMANPANEFYLMGKEATNLEKMTLRIFIMKDFTWIAKLLNLRLISPRIVAFFTRIIESTIKTRDEKGISRPDMLQLMMEARGNENSKIKLTSEEMTAQAFIFFFGGFDTSSTLMSFAAHEIAVNAEVQANLQEEIDRVLRETNGNPSYEAINGMEYLDAVLNEIQRMYPLLPMLDRVCTKRFELPPPVPGSKPFVVEPGMTIWIPAFGIQYDPDYFEEPEIFNPDRFLNNGSGNIKSTTMLAFGIGPRQCIGNRFAILEIKTVLFHLLARFYLKVCSKTIVPLELSKTFFGIASANGYWLSLEKRATDNVAQVDKSL